MKFSKKIAPLFLAFSLFVPCNGHFLSKHSRPVMISFYSLLSLYFGGKTLQETFKVVRGLLRIKNDTIDLNLFGNDPNMKKRLKKVLTVGVVLVSAPIIAFFGSLTYVTAKNLIEEIKNKDKTDSAEQEEEKPKESKEPSSLCEVAS